MTGIWWCSLLPATAELFEPFQMLDVAANFNLSFIRIVETRANLFAGWLVGWQLNVNDCKHSLTPFLWLRARVLWLKTSYSCPWEALPFVHRRRRRGACAWPCKCTFISVSFVLFKSNQFITQIGHKLCSQTEEEHQYPTMYNHVPCPNGNGTRKGSGCEFKTTDWLTDLNEWMNGRTMDWRTGLLSLSDHVIPYFRIWILVRKVSSSCSGIVQ